MEINREVRNKIVELISQLPVPLLLPAGLACWYLANSSISDSAQCIPATYFVHSALSLFDIKSLIVPARIRVSYSSEIRGSSKPTVSETGTFKGHLVIITEHDNFIDPTVLQFDDIVQRRGRSGFMPISGTYSGIWRDVHNVDSFANQIRLAIPLEASERDFFSYELGPSEFGELAVKQYVKLNNKSDLDPYIRKLATRYAQYAADNVFDNCDYSELYQIGSAKFIKLVKQYRRGCGFTCVT